VELSQQLYPTIGGHRRWLMRIAAFLGYGKMKPIFSLVNRLRTLAPKLWSWQ